jgi:excisionase family DNA binding protein
MRASISKSTIGIRLLNLREAGQYLGISFWTVRQLGFSGQLPLVKFGRRVLVDIQDLDHLIEINKQKFE